MTAETSQQDVPDRLIASAIKLMSRRAPSSITGRELAADAKVNYGLIHHYFGTKYDVFRAAIERLVQDYIDAMDSPDVIDWLAVENVRRQRTVWKVLAQFALDEKTREQIQWPYTVMRRALRQQVGDSPTVDQRELAALDAAFNFGWIIFEPVIQEAYGLDQEAMSRAVERFRELVPRSASAVG